MQSTGLRGFVRILLQFAPQQTDTDRARLRYAFSLFCAIYDHQPIFDLRQVQSADARIAYGPNGPQGSSKPTIQLDSLYQTRHLLEPAPPPTSFELGDKKTVLFHAPLPGGQPDWLGEIFEWVSCADEYSIRSRDSIGRVPFAESYVGRHKLDPRLPYAAIAMDFLQRALCSIVPCCASEHISPEPSVRHFIVSTHDVDFLPVSRAGSVLRLAKNAVISFLVHKSPMLAMDQAGRALLMILGGGNPLNQLSLLVQGQVKRGSRASYFFLAGRRHRRDANYRIEDPKILDLLRCLERHGMEIGVHGSYTSLDELDRLNSEFGGLRELGFRPQGGRQHWLRFTVDRLIAACEQAEVAYDTSLGWPDCVGFRAGACFSFPPYNFREERAATFLEIPLIVMDGSLIESGSSETHWYNHAASVLSESRHYGWGGVSLLWHNTGFGGGQLPPGVGSVFWRLVDHRSEWNDTWVCAADFVQAVWQRYARVGLLPAEPPKSTGTRKGAHHNHREEENATKRLPANFVVAFDDQNRESV